MDPERGPARRDSIRHARRISNLTAAALIAGTGVATGALAHQAAHTTAATGSAAVAGTAGAARSHATGPQVKHSVATTTPSGVTVTTTTHTVNGRTVVTKVRHAPAGRDD